MKRSYFPILSGLVAAGAIAGLSVPAHAATISIGTALNGGAITLQASGATPGPVTFSGPVGGYNINVVDGMTSLLHRSTATPNTPRRRERLMCLTYCFGFGHNRA